MATEEMSADLKNDILLGFNLYKDETEQINKLKLRTLLFSFVMYKSSATDINKFIEENFSPDQEYFTYDEVCKLVMFKLKSSKDKEADEIFNYMTSNSDQITEKDIETAFSRELKDDKMVTKNEITEMMKFMGATDGKVSRTQFKNFYTETKPDEKEEEEDDKEKSANR